MPELFNTKNFKMTSIGCLLKIVKMLKHITFYLGKQNRKLYIIDFLNQTFKIIKMKYMGIIKF